MLPPGSDPRDRLVLVLIGIFLVEVIATFLQAAQLAIFLAER